MLRPAIASIPITPCNAPKLGLMLIPFIMDVLSKKMGIDRVLALNVNGSKMYNNNVESHVQGYLQMNTKLGIIPNYIWRDDQQENVYWISHFFQQLMSAGYIRKESQLLMRCSCRSVETLATAENRSNTRKLYEQVNGILRCKVCGGSVCSEVDTVYLFEIPEVPVNWQITPDFARKEILNLVRKFVGVKLLISRTRSSVIPLWIGKEHIFLDVDFGWQLLLPILRRFNYQPMVLVGSQKNLLGCYVTMLLSYLIDKTVPELIIPGYCKTKTEEDKFALDSFPEWSRVVTRAFLACHCTFCQKELTFVPSLRRLIERAFLEQYCVDKTRTKWLSLPEALNECDGLMIRKLLATRKHERETVDYVLRELL